MRRLSSRRLRAPIHAAWLVLLSIATSVAAEPSARAIMAGPDPLAATKGPRVTVLAHDHGDVSPWVEFFTFDSRSHPKLVQLRRDHGLDAIVAGARTDLERALRLKEWVARALVFGTPDDDVFSDWSAVALLERATRGQVVWCGQAAMVFQQACWALGLPARFIETGHASNPCSHFTTEVYLAEHGKWAVVDATPLEDYDVHYEVDGVPQSALEMHGHIVAGSLERVVEVHPGRAHRVRDPRSPAHGFRFVRWLTRCDVVTHTPKFVDMENTFDRRRDTVEWDDGRTTPWERGDHAVWFVRRERLSAWRTSDPAVVAWEPTERVRLQLCPGPKDRVYVGLWTGDVEFSRFEVCIDGRDWEPLPPANLPDTSGPRLGWGPRKLAVEATPGDHEIHVRVARHDGSTGPPSFVRFRVDEQAP
jgi:hypothetical protein